MRSIVPSQPKTILLHNRLTPAHENHNLTLAAVCPSFAGERPAKLAF